MAILADLAGPKIRVGDLAKPVELTPGERVTLAPEGAVQDGDICTTYAHLAEPPYLAVERERPTGLTL